MSLNFKKEHPSSISAHNLGATIALTIREVYDEQIEEIFSLTHSVATLLSSLHILPNCRDSCNRKCLSLNIDAISSRIKTVGQPPSISIIMVQRRKELF